MKKQEIIELLEYQRNKLLSNYGKDRYEFNDRDILDWYLPKIDELKNEFDTLRREIYKIKKIREKSLKYLENKEDKISKLNCEHPVVFGIRNVFGHTSYCAFCNQELKNDKDKVLIYKKYIDAEDEYPSTIKEELNDFNEMYLIVLDILKNKNNQEEIDFNSEFIKAFEENKIGVVTVNNKEYCRYYNVLLICGSNKIQINEDTYITKVFENNIKEIFDYLNSMLRTKVTIVSSEDFLDSKKYSDKYIYNNTSELFKILNDLSENKYDLIVDLSKIFNFEIENNLVKIDEVPLNIRKLFDCCKIISMNKNENKNLIVDLKNNIENDNEYGDDFKKVLLKK